MANGTLKVENIQTSSGSGTITLGQSGETVTVPSGATLDMTNATMSLNSSMKNTPAFHVKLNADQSISDNVFTVVAYDTVILDTDNGFSTSTYRYTCPSGKSGKYFIGGTIVNNSAANSALNYSDMYIYKNTAIHSYQINQLNSNPGRQISINFGTFMDLSDGDYVEIQGRADRTAAGTLQFRGDSAREETRLYGFRIIGA